MVNIVERRQKRTVTLSIGIEYSQTCWKVCLLEDGQAAEYFTFSNTNAVFGALEQMCAFYPEPVIALSSPFEEFSNAVLNGSQSDCDPLAMTGDFRKLLLALKAINLKSYHLPAIRSLPGVPQHRKLYRDAMGGSAKLCTVATLLYRLRQRDSIWSEMRFLCLEVTAMTSGITVVSDGRIIDSIIGPHIGEMAQKHGTLSAAALENTIELAFWERLRQDLAGLLALHHLEDVVIVDTFDGNRSNTTIESLGDTYQFYHFPRHESEPAGFAAATGAAILGEGLYRPGLAAEVVERLLSSPHG